MPPRFLIFPSQYLCCVWCSWKPLSLYLASVYFVSFRSRVKASGPFLSIPAIQSLHQPSSMVILSINIINYGHILRVVKGYVIPVFIKVCTMTLLWQLLHRYLQQGYFKICHILILTKRIKIQKESVCHSTSVKRYEYSGKNTPYRSTSFYASRQLSTF